MGSARTSHDLDERFYHLIGQVVVSFSGLEAVLRKHSDVLDLLQFTVRRRVT
jgi:hypothetical protein